MGQVVEKGSHVMVAKNVGVDAVTSAQLKGRFVVFTVVLWCLVGYHSYAAPILPLRYINHSHKRKIFQ